MPDTIWKGLDCETEILIGGRGGDGGVKLNSLFQLSFGEWKNPAPFFSIAVRYSSRIFVLGEGRSFLGGRGEIQQSSLDEAVAVC